MGPAPFRRGWGGIPFQGENTYYSRSLCEWKSMGNNVAEANVLRIQDVNLLNADIDSRIAGSTPIHLYWSPGRPLLNTLKCPETKDRNATCMPSARRGWCCAIPEIRKLLTGPRQKGLPPTIGYWWRAANAYHCSISATRLVRGGTETAEAVENASHGEIKFTRCSRWVA